MFRSISCYEKGKKNYLSSDWPPTKDESEIFKITHFKEKFGNKTFYETALLDKEKIQKIYTSRLPENALNIPMKSNLKKHQNLYDFRVDPITLI